MSSLSVCIKRHVPKDQRAEASAQLRDLQEGHRKDNVSASKAKVLAVSDAITEMRQELEGVFNQIDKKIGPISPVKVPTQVAEKKDTQVPPKAKPITRGKPEWNVNPETGKKTFKRAVWSDGTIVEKGDSKTRGKEYVVIGKDKIRRRASRQDQIAEAVQGGKVLDLEMYDEKPTDTREELKVQKPVAPEAKQTLEGYIEEAGTLTEEEQKIVEDGVVLNGEEVGADRYKMLKVVSKISGVPMAKLDDVTEGNVGYALANAAKGGDVTTKNIKAEYKKAVETEENSQDTKKRSKNELDSSTTSAETMFAKQEAQAAQTDTMDDVEVEDATDFTEEEDNVGVADEVNAYVQEGKGKYSLKNITYGPDGKKVAKDKAPEGSTTVLQTPDGRYTLANTTINGQNQVMMAREGVDVGKVFDTREQAIDYAKDLDSAQESLEGAKAKDKAEGGVKAAPPRKAVVRRGGKEAAEAKALRDAKKARLEEMEQQAKDDQEDYEYNPGMSAMDIVKEAKAVGGPLQAKYDLEALKSTDGRVLNAIEIIKDELGEMTSPAASFARKYPNGLALLEHAAKSEDTTTATLAQFLLESVDPAKFEGLTVSLDPRGEKGINRHGNGHITLRPDAKGSSMVHEVVHGITVRELAANPELGKSLDKLRAQVRKEAVKGYHLTPRDIELLDSVSTSEDFMKIGKEIYNWEIAYGLMNNKEFLSMAFSKPKFQKLLKTVKVGDKTLWERVVSWVSDALGLPKKYISALEATIELVPMISKQDTKGVTEAVDSMEFEVSPETRKPPRTEDIVAKLTAGKGPKEKVKEKIFESGANFKTLAENLARPISDIIEARSKKIHGGLMKMEAGLAIDQKEYSSKVKPFMTWYRKLTPSQKQYYDVALMNSNTTENKKIIDTIPKNVMGPVNEVLKKLRQEADDVGLGVKDKEYYFPRRVTDMNGLIDHVNKDSKDQGMLGIAFRQEAERLGVKELTDEQKTQVVSDSLQSGHMRQLPRPGSTKERTVPFVTEETYDFYSNSNDSLMAHIYEMTEKIGQRKFIGGSTRKKDIQEMLSEYKKIESMEPGDKKDAAIVEYDLKAEKLEDLEADLSLRVSRMIQDELGSKSAAEQKEVIDLINARMRQRGAHGAVDLFRNVAYATTMGNFLSAITQLGDIPILLYAHGLNKDSIGAVGTAFKNVYKIVKGEMQGKRGETDAFVDQADFTNQLREFSAGNSFSATAVDKLFQLSGLKYTDLIGKEAFMQAAYKKYQRKDEKANFMEKYEPMFGKDTAEVWQKFQLGKKTDPDVVTVLFSELAEFQPVSLSQQSKQYLEGGSGRIFYMLKTFTLRATSAALREGVKDINKGGAKNIAKGVAKTVGILGIYSLAGAGADEIKDLLRGKESSITDNTIDNMLQMLFVSKYTAEKGMREGGLLKTIAANMMPPMRFADDFITDVASLTGISDKEYKHKFLQSAPLLGTILQGQSAAGQAGFATQEKKSIMEEVKNNKERGKGPYAGNLSRRISKYNKGVSRDEKITSDSVRRAYK